VQEEGGLIAEGFNGRGKWNRTGCVDVRAKIRAHGGELELGASQQVSYPAIYP
jgi:hypothetical protein